MIIKKCLVCGDEFKTYPSKIKANKGKYCSKKCGLSQTNKILAKNGLKTRFSKGTMPHNFKGYSLSISRVNGKPYRFIYMPEHPHCSAKKQVREHRLIMEKKIGRYLRSDEIVHHKDGDTLNNNLNNLELLYKKDHDRMNTPLNIHRRWFERKPRTEIIL